MQRLMYIMLPVVLVCGLGTINNEPKAITPISQRRPTYSVTLRGQVESVELINVSSSGVTILVKLNLELRNEGARPVILLEAKPPYLVGAALGKTSSVPMTGDNLVSEYFGESVARSPEWASLRRSLDRSLPPRRKVHILAPNESWWSKGSIGISLPSKPDDKSLRSNRRESWENVQKLPEVWLRVSSQVWSLNLEPPGNSRVRMAFGRKLQKRWKSVGLLWLDDIWSEPVLLDLKNIHEK